jgi:hypothetical protein
MLLRSAVLLAVLSAFPAAAAADGPYAGLGVGGGSRLGGDYPATFKTDGHMSGQVFGGYRFGPWGIEATYFGSGLTRKWDDSHYMLSAIGLTGKFHITFQYGIEWYVRAGLNQTHLAAPKNPDGTYRAFNDFSGIGLDYGTGVIWQSHPLGTSRVRPRVGGFLDLSANHVTVSKDGGQREFGGSLANIQLGVISSIDL